MKKQDVINFCFEKIEQCKLQSREIRNGNSYLSGAIQGEIQAFTLVIEKLNNGKSKEF